MSHTDAIEALDNHLPLWRAYVRVNADPTEMELWGAVRSAVDFLPDALDEIRRLRAREAATDAVLSDSGCFCECDHDRDSHTDECERCLGCRIELARAAAVQAAERGSP